MSFVTFYPSTVFKINIFNVTLSTIYCFQKTFYSTKIHDVLYKSFKCIKIIISIIFLNWWFSWNTNIKRHPSWKATFKTFIFKVSKYYIIDLVDLFCNWLFMVGFDLIFVKRHIVVQQNRILIADYENVKNLVEFRINNN